MSITTYEGSKNKSAFTCSRNKISSWNEIRPGMKKFLFTHEFHPEMKFNLKENLPLSMKKISFWLDMLKY